MTKGIKYIAITLLCIGAISCNEEEETTYGTNQANYPFHLIFIDNDIIDRVDVTFTAKSCDDEAYEGTDKKIEHTFHCDNGGGNGGEGCNASSSGAGDEFCNEKLSIFRLQNYVEKGCYDIKVQGIETGASKPVKDCSKIDYKGADFRTWDPETLFLIDCSGTIEVDELHNTHATVTDSPENTTMLLEEVQEFCVTAEDVNLDDIEFVWENTFGFGTTEDVGPGKRTECVEITAFATGTYSFSVEVRDVINDQVFTDRFAQCLPDWTVTETWEVEVVASEEEESEADPEPEVDWRSFR